MAETQTKEQPSAESLALNAVTLAGEFGWAHMGLRDVAKEANVSFSEVVGHFQDKGDILYAYGRYIDKRTLQESGEVDPALNPRERLFDLMMARFDVLNEQREGVLNILNSFMGNPAQALCSLPHLFKSMNLMLEGAGIDTNGWKGCARIVGLKGVYLKTLKTWMEDDSPDMGQTMAALDKALGQVEGLATRFNL